MRARPICETAFGEAVRLVHSPAMPARAATLAPAQGQLGQGDMLELGLARRECMATGNLEVLHEQVCPDKIYAIDCSPSSWSDAERSRLWLLRGDCASCAGARLSLC